MKMHRWLVMLGAVLTAGAILLFSLPSVVPSESAEIVGWVERSYALLAWSDELLFFAVVCWAAGIRGLLRADTSGPSVRISVGVAALAVSLVALLVMLLEVGRLVYPVFQIQLSADTLAQLVSSSFGALHLAYLGFAVAAFTLTWSTSAGRIGRAVGILAGIAFAVGSFPWLTPTWWNVTVALLLAGWGIVLGLAIKPHTEACHDAAQEAGDGG